MTDLEAQETLRDMLGQWDAFYTFLRARGATHKKAEQAVRDRFNQLTKDAMEGNHAKLDLP